MRYNLFNRQYKMNDVKEPIFKKKLKNIDALSLPNCEAAVRAVFKGVLYNE